MFSLLPSFNFFGGLSSQRSITLSRFRGLVLNGSRGGSDSGSWFSGLFLKSPASRDDDDDDVSSGLVVLKPDSFRGCTGGSSWSSLEACGLLFTILRSGLNLSLLSPGIIAVEDQLVKGSVRCFIR